VNEAPPVALIANARMPSQRAQSLQVAQCAGAFARAGAETLLLHARRRDTPGMETGQLLDRYGVPRGARPAVEALPCVDWIDLVPRPLQFVPARLQEFSFAAAAVRRARRLDPAMRVYTREAEVAGRLAGRPGLFVEVHRVPGHAVRRNALLRAVGAGARVVAISGGVAEDLTAMGVPAEGILVAHDGYEAERFARAPSRAEARARLGVGPDQPLVVYFGGLLRWKGVDVLVEATRELTGVQVLIVGGMDADVEALRRQAAGVAGVRVEGFQPPAEAPLYLAAADLTVVPNRSTPAISARYTSPLKVFEAMAMGLPLVVSDLPSLREVLTEDQARFVTPEDPTALAAAIRDLLARPEERAAMAAALRAEAPRHTWDARARRLLAWMGEAA
jgi:glycosyltransferase involved in cell wall biosynthesis